MRRQTVIWAGRCEVLGICESEVTGCDIYRLDTEGFGYYHVCVISFLKQMVVFPVRMVAETASLLSFVDATPFWSTSYKLSGEAQDGSKLLIRWLNKHGLEATRKLAEQMLERTADCEIAAMMAWIEYSLRQDWRSVAYWVEAAKQRGYKNSQMLLRIELLLAEYVGTYDLQDVADKILQRDDLPGDMSVMAMIAKAHWLMGKQQWQQAEKLAERILAIQEYGPARIIKWAACTSRGDEVGGEQQIEIARSKIAPQDLNLHMAVAWSAMGMAEQAMENLCKLDIDRFRIRESRTPIGELARSAEFATYCVGRAK